MLKFVQTCWACPEQYDAFTEEGKLVGYLRLRHGMFRVRHPNDGPIVLIGFPNGDGQFQDDERDYWLSQAAIAITYNMALQASKAESEENETIRNALVLKGTEPIPSSDYELEGFEEW